MDTISKKKIMDTKLDIPVASRYLNNEPFLSAFSTDILPKR